MAETDINPETSEEPEKDDPSGLPDVAETADDEQLKAAEADGDDGTSEDSDALSDDAQGEADVQDDAEAEDAMDGDAEPASAETEDTLEEPALTDATDTPEPTFAPAPVPAAAPEQPQKSGFGAMVMGGIAAGLIGLGAGYAGHVQGWWPSGSAEQHPQTLAQLETQAKQITDLTDQIAKLADQTNVPEAPDLTQIQQDQSDLLSSVNALADRLADTESQLFELATRLDAVETRPLAEGASDAAVAAYEAELAKLQAAMAAQRAEIEAMTDEARAMKTNAQETAQATMRRAALSRIRTALDAGGGFADALADLQSTGVTVPDVLSASAGEGVTTLADLQASFPKAARTALAVARDAAAQSGEGGGLTDFLRTQLGARSLEPREGTDPDAILSRAEAAAREGRLTDALAEIESLPETARAELSEWAAQVARRLETAAAAQKLSEELN